MKKREPHTGGTQYCAFLRGINVGGNKLIAMEALRKALEALGLKNVRTVLASGNVAFEGPEAEPATLARKIEKRIEAAFRTPTHVMLRKAVQLRDLAASNPFGEVTVTTGMKLYLTLLPGPTKFRLKTPYQSPKGEFRILKVRDTHVFWLVDPSEGGNTLDCMSFLEEEFGKEITTRNWNTILRLLDLPG